MSLSMASEEKDLKDRVCMLLAAGRPGHGNVKKMNCIGSQCLNYWRWKDGTHVEGYCNVSGKPEF